MSTFLTIIKSILSVALMLFRYAFYRAISSFLTGLVLLFIAILMFVSFYQAYMPVVLHVKPVYLQFSSDCESESTTVCTYPEASVFFTSSNKANEERMLMRGQAYKVFLDLEMPPSPTNEKLGMFMVNVKFLSAKGTVLKSSSRSCMLHYESSLVRLLRTIFYSLPLTLGITEEKQKVELNFFDDYIDDSYNPAVQAKIVIMTKQVEIYSATLRLQASFTGLRYLIFHWPVLFSCLAILGNFMTVTLLYSACVNQFMPNTKTTTSSVTQQQQNTQVTNPQRQNTTSPNNDGSTATPVTASPPANVEMVGSNAEALTGGTSTVETSTVETVNPSNVQSTSEPIVDEATTSTSCEVRKRRYTRIASVKLKFHKRQPRSSHVGQRRIRNIQTTRQDIGEVVSESLSNSDTENGVNQDGETSSNAKNSTSIPHDEFMEDASVSSDGIEVVGRCSPATVSHVRKRRKKDGGNKMKKEGKCSKTTTWRIGGKEIVADKFERNKLEENESKKNRTSSSERAESQRRIQKSVWENFCFSENWDSFKLPRIRRLGVYLQESMPAVSRKIRHCVSDLELSSVEEKRLKGGGNPKRSVSASDITSLDSNTMIMNEIYQ